MKHLINEGAFFHAEIPKVVIDFGEIFILQL
jgi:hypothetical protein